MQIDFTDKEQYETIPEYLQRKGAERQDTRLFWGLLIAVGLFLIYWAI